MQDLLDIGAPLRVVDRAEQDVHVLQTAVLGLLHEDQHKDAHGQAEDAEHQEGPPPDVVDRRRGDLRDDEVKQPLGGSADSDAVRTEARGEDLSCRQQASN